MLPSQSLHSIPHVSSISSVMAGRKRRHRPASRLKLSIALCLLLAMNPSTFSPISRPNKTSSLVSAAPAFWTPVVDALTKARSLPASISNTSHGESSIPIAETSVDANKVSTPGSEPKARIVATANDFGVVQLDLEGDPNCDYTTKVKIAGTEYNVIIDTGSSHFAVASKACKDCTIPHKENYQPGEEEEIPIDADGNLPDSPTLHKSVQDQEPLNLFRKHPKSASREQDIEDLLNKLNHLSTTTIQTATASAQGTAAQPLKPYPSILSFDEKVKADFPSFKNRPNDRGPQTAPGNFQGVFSISNKGSASDREGRYLAAAPAGNLYPVSDTSLETGQAVKVTYGIKTHSVGWSGVMTSDLMTVEMAKIQSEVELGATESSLLPGVLPENTAKSLRAGGIMEKESSVEFAAITENNNFFSKECGAQHGIWGLGYRSLSMDRKPTLFDTISASMKIPNGFALQLCGRTSNVTKSGNMFLGGYSSAHVAEPMQYVPLVKKDWYQVRLDGFKVMGQHIQGMQNLNLPKAIVDSGTTNILMSHYNLQFLIRALAQSQVVRWSSLVPAQDIANFWFQNAVLRLPRSTFQISTASHAVEIVISGVPIPIYTSSFLKIKAVPPGQAPEGYVDFWWHGFASSTSPDSIEAEAVGGGAVMPGSVGTILGETLFAGKVVFFDRGNDKAKPGDADYGRIGFARGKNCFAPADHDSVNVLANNGKVAAIEEFGPIRTAAATSEASAIKKSGRTGTNPVPVTSAQEDRKENDDSTANHAQPSSSVSQSTQPHFPGFSGLMGSASHPFCDPGLLQGVAFGLLVAIMSAFV
ncbi:Beta-secretase 2 [Entomortierella lignicola]|nr:Beta-secretase 2 [Entomortierella lignicola]